MDTKKDQYVPRKEDFINGIIVPNRFDNMDFMNKTGLFRSKSGEYYIDYQVEQIFKDPYGVKVKSENFKVSVKQVTESEAKRFLEVECNPASYPPILRGIEVLPYQFRD